MSINWAGVATVTGAFLYLLVVGTLYLWGTIVLYIVSYMRLEGDKSINTNIGGAVFPFMMIMIGIGIFSSVPILERIKSSFKFNLIVSMLLPLTVLLASFIKNFYLLVFVYGFCFGVIAGIAYIGVLYQGFLHFPAHRGKVSGISLTGQGLGVFVYSFLVRAVVNPDGLKAIISDDSGGKKYFQGESAEVAYRVPEMFRWLALIYFIQLNLANFLFSLPKNYSSTIATRDMKKRSFRMRLMNLINDSNYFKRLFGDKKALPQPEEVKQDRQVKLDKQEILEYVQQEQQDQSKPTSQQSLQLNSPQEQNNEQQKEQQTLMVVIAGDKNDQPQYVDPYTLHLQREKEIHSDQGQHCPSMRYGFKSWILYYVIIVGTMVAGPGLLINAQYKNYFIKIKDDDSFLTNVGIVASLANGLLRPGWGALIDKFTAKQILTCMGIANIILMGSLDAVARNSQGGYMAYNFLIMAIFGGALSIQPPIFAKIFGLQAGSKLFGAFWIGLGIANFFQFFVVVLLEPVIKFKGIFWIYFGIQIFVVILLQIVKFEYKWDSEIEDYNKKQRIRISKLHQ